MTRLLVNLSNSEQRKIHLVGQTLDYTLKRSPRRRSIGLTIGLRGLTVHVPTRTSDHHIDRVLQDKSDWIKSKLALWQQRRPNQHDYSHGAKLPFLGELLSLSIRPSQINLPAHRQGDELILPLCDIALTAKHINTWYQQQAAMVFEQRAKLYANQLGISRFCIKLSHAKTRWGSCNTKGEIRLNLHLVKLPLHLIDYVVVHELAHRHEMNHSAAFWRVVARVLPNYEALRRELKTISLASLSE